MSETGKFSSNEDDEMVSSVTANPEMLAGLSFCPSCPGQPSHFSFDQSPFENETQAMTINVESTTGVQTLKGMLKDRKSKPVRDAQCTASYQNCYSVAFETAKTGEFSVEVPL